MPLPLAPTRPTFWPGWTFIEAPSNSTRAPRRRVTSLILSTGSVTLRWNKADNKMDMQRSRGDQLRENRPYRNLRMTPMNAAAAPLPGSDRAGFRREFVEFAIRAGVLRFGEFKTKAGRLSPYFFNAGLFCDGARLGELGRYYAQAALASGIAFDVLFGPAYKGITLAVGHGGGAGRARSQCAVLLQPQGSQGPRRGRQHRGRPARRAGRSWWTT